MRSGPTCWSRWRPWPETSRRTGSASHQRMRSKCAILRMRVNRLTSSRMRIKINSRRFASHFYDFFYITIADVYSWMDCASSNGRLYLLYSCAVNKHHVTCALGMRLLSAVSIVFQLKHLSVTDVQKPLHITSFCSMHTYTPLRRQLVSFALSIFTLYCAGAWCHLRSAYLHFTVQAPGVGGEHRLPQRRHRQV